MSVIKPQSVQVKFQKAREELSSCLVERDEEVDLVLTALICREHPLLVGPPGTAKSLLLDGLMAWMDNGVSKFSILFTKFTTPEEVFGPISVQGLKNDVYRRVTTGKLPEAKLAFADEIFKASSAILNTMLRIMNERMYENGDGTFRRCPLRILLGASNEWAGDQDGGKELGALFDRFLFRKKVQPVSKDGRKRLLWDNLLGDFNFSATITVEELDTAFIESTQMEWSDEAHDALELILQELNNEGICPGDRRQVKSVKAAQAYAYLCGADTVCIEHLEILAHVLWSDPIEQPEKAARIIAKIANPTKALITEKLGIVQDILAKCSPTESVPKLQAVQKELKALNQDIRRDQAIQYVGQQIKIQYEKITGV